MTITPAKILLLAVCAVSAHTHAQDLNALQATARHCLTLAGAARLCGQPDAGLDALCQQLVQHSGLPQQSAWQASNQGTQGRWISPYGGTTCQDITRQTRDFKQQAR